MHRGFFWDHQHHQCHHAPLLSTPQAAPTPGNPAEPPTEPRPAQDTLHPTAGLLACLPVCRRVAAQGAVVDTGARGPFVPGLPDLSDDGPLAKPYARHLPIPASRGSSVVAHGLVKQTPTTASNPRCCRLPDANQCTHLKRPTSSGHGASACPAWAALAAIGISQHPCPLSTSAAPT